MTVAQPRTKHMTIKEQAVSDALPNLIAYLRRQGRQCNRQQPVVPVAGSELLKAADALEYLTDNETSDDVQDGGAATMKAASHPLEQQQAVSGDVEAKDRLDGEGL